MLPNDLLEVVWSLRHDDNVEAVKALKCDGSVNCMPMIVARRHGRKKVERYLVDECEAKCLKPEYTLDEVMHLYRNDEYEVANDALHRGAIQQNPLHAICSYQHADTSLLARYMDEGADPDQEDTVGRTPLYYACYGRDATHGLECARLLLERGANVHTVPLIRFPLRSGHEELLELLLSYGADQNDGYPILKCSSPRYAKLLRKFGAKVNAADNFGRTLLQEALHTGRRKLADYLVRAGANTVGATL